MSDSIQSKLPDLPFRALAPYLFIAFGLAWGIIGLYIFWGEGMSTIFGPLTGNHPLFKRSGGSILLSAFFHFSLMNPIFPDAQPYDTYLLLAITALIVGWNRKTMFRRSGSVTVVVPAAAARAECP